ncbi:MAG: imidazole glycerol phosphate synthase subunit HisF [Rhodospirillaceae bacterium]
MPKHRLIATLLVNEGHVVQTRKFKRTNVIGNAFTAVDFFNSWAVDEIMVLEISRDAAHLAKFVEIVEGLSRRCFVPLTVGGKIRDVDMVTTYTRAGADKIVINTNAVRTPELIRDVADAFGTQCVVVSIDARPDESMPSGYRVVVENGTVDTELDAVRWAQAAADHGAGEIMVNSIDHDGDKRGYDLALVRRVARHIPIPLIAMGGVGKWDDLVAGITEGGADAAAAGNIFHYTEHSTKKAKEHMMAAGLPMRRSEFYKVNMPRRPKYRPF